MCGWRRSCHLKNWLFFRVGRDVLFGGDFWEPSRRTDEDITMGFGKTVLQIKFALPLNCTESSHQDQLFFLVAQTFLLQRKIKKYSISTSRYNHLDKDDHVHNQLTHTMFTMICLLGMEACSGHVLYVPFGLFSVLCRNSSTKWNFFIWWLTNKFCLQPFFRCIVTVLAWPLSETIHQHFDISFLTNKLLALNHRNKKISTTIISQHKHWAITCEKTVRMALLGDSSKQCGLVWM